MKLVCEIELPENADFKTKLDAMAEASRNESLWREVRTKHELKKYTDLSGKCGSCKYFKQIERLCGATCYGKCEKGLSIRQRTVKACKRYVPND